MATAVRPYVQKVSGIPIVTNWTESSAVKAGDVVVVNGLTAIAHEDIPAYTGGQALDALAIGGGIYAAMADGAISLGVEVYWDATNFKATLTASGNQRLGISVAGPTGGLEGAGTAADGDTLYFLHRPSGLGSSIVGTIGGSTAAAGSTTTDAGVLPAGTAQTYPTTAADGTKGVRLNAADKVTGRIIFIGNQAAAVLKIYPPTGGNINGLGVDAAFSTASQKGGIIQCLSAGSNTWLGW